MIPSIDPSSIRRILVIKLRAIGDVVLSTVVLDNLRRAFPGAQIHFLTESPAADLLVHNPAVDEILVFDRKSMSGGALIQSVRRHQYDLVMDLFGNPRTALVTRLSGARHRVGYRFRGRTYAYNHRVQPRGDRVHNTQFNLDALEAIGIPVDSRVPSITLGSEDRTWASDFVHAAAPAGGRVIAINAGGGWYTKRWGLERFAMLADRLADAYRGCIVLLWGPGERDDAEQIATAMKTPAILPPPTTLLQLAAFLERCDLLITNDSGPMHIAAAMRTRVVAIFGPTNPVLQGPAGDGHVVVRREGLDCLGCNLTSCPIGHPCMLELSVDAVYAGVRSVLSEGSPSAEGHGSDPRDA